MCAGWCWDRARIQPPLVGLTRGISFFVLNLSLMVNLLKWMRDGIMHSGKTASKHSHTCTYTYWLCVSVLQPVARLPRQSPFPLLCQAAVGTLWKDFGLVSYESVRMEGKYLYLPDWCFIHQFKTVAPLTLDSGRWRLLRVYDPSLTPRRGILLECVHLCACVGVTVYKRIILAFLNGWGGVCLFFFFYCTAICLSYIICTDTAFLCPLIQR